MKVCTKLSIPYLSLHLWLQVCGSFPLMQETKSISFSNLPVELKCLLGAGAALPPCSFCSSSGSGGTGRMCWHWPGVSGFHTQCPLCCWNGAWWSLSPAGSVPGLLCHFQLLTANAITPLSVFITLHRPYKNVSKQQLLRAQAEHLQIQGLAHSGWRLFCLFFPSNCCADVFLWAYLPFLGIRRALGELVQVSQSQLLPLTQLQETPYGNSCAVLDCLNVFEVQVIC